jgi:hypothetical protein
MTFEPLFTTARVIGALYKIVLTIWLLYHLAKRIRSREVPRNGRTSFGSRSHHKSFA